MHEGITRALAITREQLQHEARQAAHAGLQPTGLADITVTRGHPVDNGADAAVEVAWSIIHPLRESLLDWQAATSQAAEEIVWLKREVEELAKKLDLAGSETGAVMPIRCWYHTTFSGYRHLNKIVEHDYNPHEVARLLERFSHGDWEDGPRCLDEVLVEDDRRPLEPRRWEPS